ncbi:UNVERIFIED_CONTAM: hypothetical protein HDU68_002952 [Siphonaria sp. JEL0065]|nr:hypothetical protein HDU68_002952 [Siphonaria sp. JEL0065]
MSNNEGLPEGWTKHLDEQYQAFYYSHPQHGSTWEVPVAAGSSETTATTTTTHLDDGHGPETTLTSKLREAVQDRIVADEPLPGYEGTEEDAATVFSRDMKKRIVTTTTTTTSTAATSAAAANAGGDAVMSVDTVAPSSTFAALSSSTTTIQNENTNASNANQKVVRDKLSDEQKRASVMSFVSVSETQEQNTNSSLHRLATSNLVPENVDLANEEHRAFLERQESTGQNVVTSPLQTQQYMQAGIYGYHSVTPATPYAAAAIAPVSLYQQQQPQYGYPPQPQQQAHYEQYQQPQPQYPPATPYQSYYQQFNAPITANSFDYAASSVAGPVEPIRAKDDQLESEKAYLAKFPGAKRVSYMPNGGSGSVAGSVREDDQLKVKPLSEDEAYYSRLPAGAKRVSYSPVPEDAKPLSAAPAAGSYGTNNNQQYPRPSPLGQNAETRGESRLRKEEERQRRKEENRRFCCCFKTRKGCCLVIFLIVFLILAGLGVAAYFFWPRIPQITISEPFLNPTTVPFTASGSLTSASTQQPFVIQMNLAVNVNVFSPNYESITVNNVYFTGQLLSTDSKTPIPNANVNGQSGSVTFPSNKNTQFMMPLTVMYSLTSGLAEIASDPALSLFASQCNGSGGNIKMGYTVNINLAIIAWTGYKPSFTGTTQFPCPNLSSAVSGLLA